MNVSTLGAGFLCLLPSFLFAQIQIDGTVIDYETSNGISGVHIYIKGSEQGTVTDVDGRFSIETPEPNTVLSVRHPDYFTWETAVHTSSPEMQIVMYSRFPTIDTIVTFDPQTYEEQAQVVYNELVSPPSWMDGLDGNTEDYTPIRENRDQNVIYHPVSTFSIDIDQASYANIRRYINNGQRPPIDAVRIEELINYFHYAYPEPEGKDPVSITTEYGDCPWDEDRKLLRIGLKAKEIDLEDAASANLVFLVDVSGSMDEPNKLPLVKSSLRLLVQQLRPQDRVALVVYAGAAGTVLPSTSGAYKDQILQAIDQLEAGGSTAGSEGIEFAYQVAKENYQVAANNRIVLVTDGDFNVGPSSDGELLRLIEEKRREHIYLSVLGFGMGNYKDNKLELLADHGNGHFAYIDNIQEARKVLVGQFAGSMFVVAQDVKVQLEFNPYFVDAYRLVGYENRLLQREDFDNDSIDAGEMGAGHTVTALYEIVPAAQTEVLTSALKYQQSRLTRSARNGSELATLSVRYHFPGKKKNQMISSEIGAQPLNPGASSTDFQFAVAVAGFGLILRESPANKKWQYADILAQARSALGGDPFGYRQEFIRMVQTCEALGWQLKPE